MKEIRIITIHFGVNHGSALQAYALSTFLNSKGYNSNSKGYNSSRIINYIPNRYHNWSIYKNAYYGKYPLLLLLGYYPIYLFKSMPNRLIFRNFLKKYVPLTKKYNSFFQLKSDPPKADVYIAGSDQIWNSDYNGDEELSYYLGFGSNNTKRIAYAASFGKSYPLSDDEIRIISNELSRFDSISVREDDAVKIVNQCKLNATEVCDPTLLLGQQEWLKISDKTSFKEKYVLIYVMDSAYEYLLENASFIAKKTGLKIYVICFTKIKDKRIDKCFDNCSPNKFISLFSQASFVVTNSFHGTAFSLIFRKRMIVLEKNNYNSRMKTILNHCGLIDRLVSYNHVIDESEFLCYEKQIDTVEFNDRLNEWVNDSKAFLEKCIGGDNNGYGV